MYSSEKHYKLIESEHNQCMIFFVAKDSADLVSLSEVYVRILTNIFYSISNEVLQMKGESLSTRLEKRDLFLDYSIRFIRGFYFDVCLLLKKTLFSVMFEQFELNVDFCTENLKIINYFYLQYCIKKFK